MDPYKILIAYDGSESANIAIEDLSFAGLPSEGEAILLHTIDTIYPLPEGSSYAPEEKEIQVLANTLLSEGKRLTYQSLPNYTVTTELRMQDAAEAILQKAEEWMPDLIVLGSRGLTGFNQVMFGSVSHQVVTHARTSVRIGRFSNTWHNAPKILVPIDGSVTSIAALKEVAKRCWQPETAVRLVTVLTPSLLLASSATLSLTIQELTEAKQQERIKWIMSKHQEEIDAIRAKGIELSTVTKVGSPKHQILNEAKEWNADEIIMGSLLLSNFERLMIGSVSSYVAARASCSVEIVR